MAESSSLRGPSRPARPLLLAAATRWEAAPLASALGLAYAGEGRFEGLFAHRRVTLLRTGLGERATRGALEAERPADYGLALSAGLCGALQPGLRAGDVVADPHEADLDFVVALRDTAKSLGTPFHFGRLLHTNVILAPEAKRRLGAEQRSLACDMETAALRRWAQGSELSVLGVRAVLDELDERVPPAPAGENAASWARYACSNVGAFPLLLRTGWRTFYAMRSLSRFLAAYLEALSR